jgi:hypothetical protein
MKRFGENLKDLASGAVDKVEDTARGVFDDFGEETGLW